MKKQNYHCSITANVSVKEAIENINHVSAWWTENFEGHSEKLNDIFTVRFGETFVTFKVIEVIAGKKIVWQVTDCYLHWLKDKKEWNDTKLLWEISTVNNLTQINFTHIGLAPEIECYDNCVKGWDQYVKGSLLKLITEGKGLPERKRSSEVLSNVSSQ